MITRPGHAGEPAVRLFAELAGDNIGPHYRSWLNHVLPQASITVWPASGHFPHLAHPRRFAECLAATARWSDLARQADPAPLVS